MVIKEFIGQYGFLSNFYSSPFKINNIEYKTVEHWFQSQKSNDLDEQNTIKNANTPAVAKSLGNKCQLRWDWERAKLIVMEGGVRAKFSQNPELKQLLIETGDQELEEGNRWGDSFWGIDLNKNEGLNHLGKILMQVRADLMDNKDMTSFLVETWRNIILGEHKSWVLFSNGTCVIIMEPIDDLSNKALEMIKKWGPVHVGSAAGDFSVKVLKDYPGWVVTCHHPDILTYVGINENENIKVIKSDKDEVIIGRMGRIKRDIDSAIPIIIHVEDKTIKKK